MKLSIMYQELIQQFEYYYIHQDYLKAIEKLHLAIEAGAVNGTNYFYLGLMYEKTRQLEAASKYFGIAVGHSPNEPLFWFYYGEALKTINQIEDGIAAIEYGKLINSQFEVAFQNVSEHFKWAENIHLETNFWQVNIDPAYCHLTAPL